jgi:hypothetical protein
LLNSSFGSFPPAVRRKIGVPPDQPKGEAGSQRGSSAAPHRRKFFSEFISAGLHKTVLEVSVVVH